MASSSQSKTKSEGLEVRKRAGTICVSNQKLLLVRLKDPHTGIARYYPPGGGIEKGESTEVAALRETLEETGYHVRLNITTQRTFEYAFTWAGVPRWCVTTLYLARLDPDYSQPQAFESVSENLGPEWISLSKVSHYLNFDSALASMVSNMLEQLNT